MQFFSLSLVFNLYVSKIPFGISKGGIPLTEKCRVDQTKNNSECRVLVVRETINQSILNTGNNLVLWLFTFLNSKET